MPQFLLAAGVEPGRALVAGFHGRTWLAWATVDGDEPSARVIHEAREAAAEDPAQGKKMTVAFMPSAVIPQRDAADAKSAKRVFIQRYSNNPKLAELPLVVDVASDRLSVGEEPAPPPAIRGIADDDPYFVKYDPMKAGHGLYHASPPSSRAKLVLDDPPDGWMVRTGDEIHVAGVNCSIIDLKTHKVRVGADPVPWLEGNRWQHKNQPLIQVKRNNDDFRLERVDPSSHYGILVTTLTNLGKIEVVQAKPADSD